MQVSTDTIGIEEHDHGHHLRREVSYIQRARSSASARPLYLGVGQIFARQRLDMATDANLRSREALLPHVATDNTGNFYTLGSTGDLGRKAASAGRTKAQTPPTHC